MKKTIISILTLSISSIAVLSSNNSSVSALTYSEDVDVNFTFNTSLTVSLSSSNIVINDLTPGTSDNSNIVDINVVTNNINGYYLTSTVGNNSDTDSSSNLIHNTTNLVHSNGTNTFTSLSPSDSIVDLSTYDTSSLVNPNVWGYSYSIDNQSTWSNYSGLPLYTNTGVTLSDKYVPSNDTINFKIGAKSSPTQIAGTYTNTINFITTAYPNPLTLAESYAYFNKSQTGGYYTMQDMEPGICATATENSELTVIDVRDNNAYTIAKLADGRCWMTTNLNLEGGTEIESTLSDVPEGYTLPVANGFQEGNRLPESQIIASDTALDGGFSNDTQAYVFNSRNTACKSNSPCYSYYSWVSATAGSGTSISTTNTDAPYSVCPKRWSLPTTRSINGLSSDFQDLTVSLGGSRERFYYDSSTAPTANAIFRKMVAAPINYVRSGHYQGNSFYSGGYGAHYWSSTAANANQWGNTALDLSITASTISFANTDVQRFGFSVRCISNNQ